MAAKKTVTIWCGQVVKGPAISQMLVSLTFLVPDYQPGGEDEEVRLLFGLQPKIGKRRSPGQVEYKVKAVEAVVKSMTNLLRGIIWDVTAFVSETNWTGGPLSNVIELKRTKGGRIYPIYLEISEYDIRTRKGKARIFQELA